MNYKRNNELNHQHANKHPIIGVTGGIGSGKTILTDHLASFGIQVIDADLVSREVVMPNSFGLTEIVNYFGTDILSADGSLNRAKLREIIFTDSKKKTWLENLLHPLIAKTIQKKLNAATSQYIILSSPLLFETKQNAYVNSSILVDVPIDTQIVRATTRDSNSVAQIKTIIAAQMSREDKTKLADWLIPNTGTIDEFYRAIEELHQQIITFYQLES